ncbi:MAG: 2-dehydropantoate 2-reductase [Betaproteobacteria bacterium]
MDCIEMRVAVLGLGAMGGLFAALLVRSGVSVSALARGETLQRLLSRGLILEMNSQQTTHAIPASHDPLVLGKHDLVIVAVKAPALPALAHSIEALRAPGGVVLSAMNGVPWWFFQGFGGVCEGMRLQTVDPGGMLAATIPPGAVLGSVLHMSASTPAPAHVLHATGLRVILGEPSGEMSGRLARIAACFQQAGFAVETSPRIHDDIWFKLWGNMTMNPISALTGATIDRMLDDPQVSRFCLAVMREAREIGERFGCRIAQQAEERNAVTRKLGAFRTSMLQDVEAGRPVELDALLGVVKEIAQALGCAVPAIDALLGLTRLRMQTLGLYP